MKTTRIIYILLFNSLSLGAMDTPKQEPTTFSDDTLVKLTVEGSKIEPLALPWGQVKLSGLGKMIDDLGYDKSLSYSLPAGLSLDSAKKIFTILKPYAESSLTNDEDRLKKELDPQLKKLPLSELIEVAHGANLLDINQSILKRIGVQCTELITEIPSLMVSDYQAIDSMNKDFFKAELSIKPEPIMADIKKLLLKKQLNYGKQLEFDVGFNPVMGRFYEDSSIVVAGMASENLSIYNDKGTMIAQENYKDIVFSGAVAVIKNFIAFTLPDNQIIIQQRSHEKKICQLKVNTRSPYNELLFSPNNKYLIFFSRHNNLVVHLWDIGSIDWSEEEPSLDWTKSCEINGISELDRLKAIYFISDTQLLIAGRKKIEHQLLKATVNFEKNFLECNVDEKIIIDRALSYDEKTIFSVDGKCLLDCYWDNIKSKPSYIMTVHDIKFDIEENKKTKIEAQTKVKFELESIKEWDLLSMCFNSDNTLVACGTQDKQGTIMIYDALTGSLVHSFSGLRINNMIQFNSDDTKMMTIGASTDPYDKKINYPNLGKVALWDVFTKDYSSAVKRIEDYDQSKLTFLYRFLSFLKINKKYMELKDGDAQQFNWLDYDLKRLLNYSKQPSQEKKPSYQPHSFQSTWSEKLERWRNDFLNAPGRKAMIFYGTLVTGVSAIGYALYKYLTSSTTAKD